MNPSIRLLILFVGLSLGASAFGDAAPNISSPCGPQPKPSPCGYYVCQNALDGWTYVPSPPNTACTTSTGAPGGCDGTDDGVCNTCTNSCNHQFGAQTYNANGTIRGCNTGTEICNGCDDDGDGTVDNVEYTTTALSQACNRPDGPVCAVGGTQTCTAGAWSQCSGCSGFTADCSSGQGINCANGDAGHLCDSSCHAIAGPCRPQTCISGNETATMCNGCDDNCDGFVDNNPGQGNNTLTRPAAPNGCADAGVQTCTSPGFWGSAHNCSGAMTSHVMCTKGPCGKTAPIMCGPDCVGDTQACLDSISTDEICNNCDDNGNGVIDEGLSCEPNLL